MEAESELSNNTRNNIIAIICAGVFLCCTVLISFLRLSGGFLSTNRRQFYWDEIVLQRRTISYARFGRNSDLRILWEFLPQWGNIWFVLCFLAAVLISIPPLMKLLKQNPDKLKIPLSLIGLIIGFVAIIVEYGLFVILRTFHDWGANIPVFNIFILGYFVIGVYALFIGYRYPMKRIVSEVSSLVTLSPPEITLTAEEIHKYFGGVKALAGTTVMVERNKLISLIGPNGCGKTTLFNVITGWLIKTNPNEFVEEVELEVEKSLRALIVRTLRSLIQKLNPRKMKEEDVLDVGKVIFEDQRVDGYSAHETALTGMMRTFQTTRNWANLTVLENLLVAPHNQTGESLLRLFINRKQIKEDERKNTLKALEVLEFLEITHIRDQIAQELSGGQLKLLALGRLLMTAPNLLLLDEPMAGINPTLGNKVMDKIVELKEDATVFLIEHNMDVVFNYSDDIFVMASGKIIAQGEPAEIEQNRDVIEAYLGKDY